MFSVIEFEDGLQLVPYSWVNEEELFCLWPPVFFNQFKLNKMVAAEISPEETWTKLKILKHFGKSDSYKRGIEKLNLCMAQSDIDTAPSEEEKARRKIVRKRIINHSDSEDETLESSLPSFPKQPVKKQKLSKHKENHFEKINEIQVEQPKNMNASTVQHTHPNCGCDTENSSDKQFKELILGKLNFLINRIAALEEKVDSLRSANVGDMAPASSELMKKFPIKDISELNEMEKFISIEENYDTLVLSLKGIGGSNDQHVIRNMLKRICSNEVAEKFSWLGAKEKSSFKKLQITKAILDTTRLHCPSITEEIFANVVANWLRHSKQRREREKGFSGKSSTSG